MSLDQSLARNAERPVQELAPDVRVEPLATQTTSKAVITAAELPVEAQGIQSTETTSAFIFGSKKSRAEESHERATKVIQERCDENRTKLDEAMEAVFAAREAALDALNERIRDFTVNIEANISNAENQGNMFCQIASLSTVYFVQEVKYDYPELAKADSMPMLVDAPRITIADIQSLPAFRKLARLRKYRGYEKNIIQKTAKASLEDGTQSPVVTGYILCLDWSKK